MNTSPIDAEKIIVRVLLISPQRKYTHLTTITMPPGSDTAMLIDFLIEKFSKRWIIDFEELEVLQGTLISCITGKPSFLNQNMQSDSKSPIAVTPQRLSA